MKDATLYARALYAAHEAHPLKHKSLLHNLSHILKRRGHLKLLPKILSEYERLHLRAERLTRYRAVSKESERTRILLELYRRLIHTHA